MKVIYLGMPSKEGRQSKILKKNGVSSFDSKKNAGIFSRFFSLLQNLLHKKTNLESKPMESIISRFTISVRILFYSV